jgi:hypothetical protein
MLVAREGWVWSISGGFPWYTLMQLNLAERIGDAARVLAEDAADHLEAHARHAYDPEANHFRPMWADGTDVTGLKIPRTGYGRGNRGDAYEPNPATPRHLAAYARAYRLTRRPLLWQTARNMALGLGLGDPGEMPGENPSLRVEPDHAGPEAIFALLEMFKTEPHPAYLDAARKLADNIVEQRFHKGFFLPSKSHYNANFDALEPLAILAVDAATAGKLAELPPYIAGRGYIHGRFDGHGRTYDHRVIWNQTRSICLRLDASSHYGRQHGSPNLKEGFHHFNGEDDSVTLSASTAFEDNDLFSIVIRVRAFDDNRFLCAYRYHLSRKEFRTRGADGLRVGLDIDDSDVHVIVITYDGTSPDGTRTLTAYVDGKRVDQAMGTGSPLSSYPARHLHVGKTEHSGGVYSNVAIEDDIRIFSRVLDNAEIGRAINRAR